MRILKLECVIEYELFFTDNMHNIQEIKNIKPCLPQALTYPTYVIITSQLLLVCKRMVSLNGVNNKSDVYKLAEIKR